MTNGPLRSEHPVGRGASEAAEREPRGRSAEASRFDALGYAPLEGFLDRACLDELRHEAQIALQGPPMAGCERPHNRLAALRWADPLVRLILADPARSARLARCIGADDLRWISGYVSAKNPHSAPLWWHQDWWCWDHPVSWRPAAPQVALLCYLSDTTPRTGALRVLPGSHRRSLPLHALLSEAHGQGEQLPRGHAALDDQPGQVTLAVRAGDAVVLDYRLLHGTHANDCDQRRDCVLLSFTPSWSGLPVELRAHLIQHLALPTATELQAARHAFPAALLPAFAGDRRDLPVNVRAPTRFAVGGA